MAQFYSLFLTFWLDKIHGVLVRLEALYLAEISPNNYVNFFIKTLWFSIML